MLSTSIFSSRKLKFFFLTEIIYKLNIHKEEKDLYIFCLEILEDKEFNIFFQKIYSQVWENWENFNKKIINPFTAILL